MSRLQLLLAPSAADTLLDCLTVAGFFARDEAVVAQYSGPSVRPSERINEILIAIERPEWDAG